MQHIHKKIDYTVEVFIVYKNKVLLRMHDKFNTWLSVGGHIELNEDPIEAAIREVKEEVGLEVEIIGGKKGIGDGSPKNKGYQDLIPPKYLGMHPAGKIHKHITLVYFAISNSDKIFDATNDEEKTETCWVTKEQLEKMNLVPNVLFYAKEALKELGEK